jgi:hypothetical protein
VVATRFSRGRGVDGVLAPRRDAQRELFEKERRRAVQQRTAESFAARDDFYKKEISLQVSCS